MKLFNKYNRINLTASIFTFVAGSVVFYFLLSYIFLHQLDKTLHAEQVEIEEYIKSYNKLPPSEPTTHHWVTVAETDKRIGKREIKSYLMYNKKENEDEWTRQLSFTVTIGSQLYKISINKSEVEADDLLKLIVIVVVGMIALVILINYIVNRTIVNRLWQPFHATIKQVRQYHLDQRKSLQLPKQQIDEFNLLNESLNAMTQNIYNDYETLKAFTENASHEMQTPLAIIRSKTEMLLQNNSADEEVVKQLLSIEDYVNKLSRLNQSLLLLTKIENSQFILNEPVNLTIGIEHKLDERAELFTSKNLQIEKSLEPVILQFHQHLADILLNNLLSNALRYTPAGGMVEIALTNKQLTVKNSASSGPLNSDKIFERFYKPDQSKEGVGLGLSIIKEICIAAGFNSKYSYEKDMHVFTIVFK
ncbi:ATP-binding protein [Chitinophagaceae bacterium LWZ2-11]